MDGSSGANGANGATGATGATGSNGLNGTNGTNGASGVAGPAGQAGAAGPIGPQGPAGLNWAGAWSAANPYNKGDGVSYEGSSYIATAATYNQNPPSSTNPEWNVLAVAGAAGEPGPAGLKGINGTNGTNGAAGATGAAGPAGKDLLNRPGSIATYSASIGCPAGSTTLGTSLLLYSPPKSKTVVSSTVVFCQY
jgi:hypothetical protein